MASADHTNGRFVFPDRTFQQYFNCPSAPTRSVLIQRIKLFSKLSPVSHHETIEIDAGRFVSSVVPHRTETTRNRAFDVVLGLVSNKPDVLAIEIHLLDGNFKNARIRFSKSIVSTRDDKGEPVSKIMLCEFFPQRGSTECRVADNARLDVVRFQSLQNVRNPLNWCQFYRSIPELPLHLKVAYPEG